MQVLGICVFVKDLDLKKFFPICTVLQILVRSFGYALRLLDSRVEQLAGDVDVVREDSSQLIEKVSHI